MVGPRISAASDGPVRVDRVIFGLFARTSAYPLTAAELQTSTNHGSGPNCGHLADRLIYLKTVSETRPQLTFGRKRYVQIIRR